MAEGAAVAAEEAYEEGSTSKDGSGQALTQLVELIHELEADAGAEFKKMVIDALEQKVISGVRDEARSYAALPASGLKGFFRAQAGNAGKIQALHRLSQHIMYVKGEEAHPLVRELVRQIDDVSFRDYHNSLPEMKNALTRACEEVPAPETIAAAAAPQPRQSWFRRRRAAPVA